MAQILKTVNPTESFEQFLVQNGFLPAKTMVELQAAQKQSGQNIAEMLLAKKLIDEEDLTKAKAAFFNIPYVDLRKVNIPQAVATLIPAESVNFYNIVPFELGGRVLKVAITDPSNLAALEALEFLCQKQNLQVQLFLASAASVDTAIGRKKNLKRVVGQALEDIQKTEDADTGKR